MSPSQGASATQNSDWRLADQTSNTLFQFHTSEFTGLTWKRLSQVILEAQHGLPQFEGRNSEALLVDKFHAPVCQQVPVESLKAMCLEIRNTVPQCKHSGVLNFWILYGKLYADWE